MRARPSLAMVSMERARFEGFKGCRVNIDASCISVLSMHYSSDFRKTIRLVDFSKVGGVLLGGKAIGGYEPVGITKNFLRPRKNDFPKNATFITTFYLII